MMVTDQGTIMVIMTNSEDDILTFKLIFSEYIAAQAACVDHDHCDRHGDKDTVQKYLRKSNVCWEVQVIVYDRLLRDQRLHDGLDLIVCLKGREHHPYERKTVTTPSRASTIYKAVFSVLCFIS